MANFSSFGELIGNGKTYYIPAFQRDYAWGDEEWEDLWYDISELVNEGKHYMGYVVLQMESEGKRRYKIVDGQQRFTTLSLIYLAGIKLLNQWVEEGIESENNKIRAEKLRERFISNTPASSLISSSKLTLNRNNEDFYQSYLMRLRTPNKTTKLKPSEKKLWKAFSFFSKKLTDAYNKEKSGSVLADFLEEQLAERLEFTVIEVQDDLNAYKVFETLNARGVKLSTVDLLKNYFFSVTEQAGTSEIEHAERQWQQINDQLADADFPVFLRHFWNSRNPLERTQTIFKSIKKEKNTPKLVVEFLDDLQDAASIYVAFSSPEHTTWDKEQTQALKELILFNVTQCYPLLLTAYERFFDNQPQEFTRILKGIVVISFRYLTISGLNPNELELIYNRVSQRLYKKDLLSAADVLKELKDIYVLDETFKNNFALKEIPTTSSRNKKLIRYILFKLENQLSGTGYDFEDNTATIEHILPENPDIEWEDNFKSTEFDEYVYVLGNYTLLEKSKNNLLGNTTFENKKSVYQESSYQLTSRKLDFEEWNPSAIRKRQKEMSNIAGSVWKINF
jgi:uncharacterized protein with ParB-like and HNH nuclease domain